MKNAHTHTHTHTHAHRCLIITLKGCQLDLQRTAVSAPPACSHAQLLLRSTPPDERECARCICKCMQVYACKDARTYFPLTPHSCKHMPHTRTHAGMPHPHTVFHPIPNSIASCKHSRASNIMTLPVVSPECMCCRFSHACQAIEQPQPQQYDGQAAAGCRGDGPGPPRSKVLCMRCTGLRSGHHWCR